MSHTVVLQHQRHVELLAAEMENAQLMALLQKLYRSEGLRGYVKAETWLELEALLGKQWPDTAMIKP